MLPPCTGSVLRWLDGMVYVNSGYGSWGGISGTYCWPSRSTGSDQGNTNHGHLRLGLTARLMICSNGIFSRSANSRACLSTGSGIFASIVVTTLLSISPASALELLRPPRRLQRRRNGPRGATMYRYHRLSFYFFACQLRMIVRIVHQQTFSKCRGI